MPLRVNIKPLKKDFARNLPPESHLRQLLLEEADEVDAADYCARLSVWLRLMEIESRESNR